MLHAVIMAGGSGTRFWPASRNELPKQLLNLVGDETMIQDTVARLGDLVPHDRLLIVTNRRLVAPIAEQLPQVPAAAIIGEPCKRDTAPCIGLASALIDRHDPDATMIVLPADHVIQAGDTFRAAIRHAVRLVEQQPARIVTFGIRPSYPAEVFGYIERGERLDGNAASDSAGDSNSAAAFRVKRFREKPSRAVAEEYLASGNFYWNAGIFVWKSAAIMAALKRFEPAMHEHLAAIAAAVGQEKFPAVLDREFAAIQGKSIDYAVMERYEDVAVIEAPFDWDDAGNWQAMARIRGADSDGNTIAGRHLGVRTAGCIVRTSDEHLVVTLGLQDTIVVHTPDATLVANKHDEEAMRQIVGLLKERGWEEYL